MGAVLASVGVAVGSFAGSGVIGGDGGGRRGLIRGRARVAAVAGAMAAVAAVDGAKTSGLPAAHKGQGLDAGAIGGGQLHRFHADPHVYHVRRISIAGGRLGSRQRLQRRLVGPGVAGVAALLIAASGLRRCRPGRPAPARPGAVRQVSIGLQLRLRCDLDGVRHEMGPDRRAEGAAEGVVHRRVVQVSGPDRRDQRGLEGVADEPGVAMARRGAGLAVRRGNNAAPQLAAVPCRTTAWNSSCIAWIVSGFTSTRCRTGLLSSITLPGRSMIFRTM